MHKTKVGFDISRAHAHPLKKMFNSISFLFLKKKIENILALLVWTGMGGSLWEMRHSLILSFLLLLLIVFLFFPPPLPSPTERAWLRKERAFPTIGFILIL